MPAFVTSMDVVPPRRTENSGMSSSSNSSIRFRLMNSGSHFFFSSKGACYPNAENVS